MLTFHGNIRTKIILRKKGGHFSNEETNIGVIVTKPNYYDEDKNKLIESKNKAHQRKAKEKVKLNAIQRVIKSTNQILQPKQINYNEIYPKLSMNISEHVLESTYNNNYCASIHKTFSKLDSPLILIPTLASRESGFDYEMKIYSTKPTEIYSLFTDSCATLVGEWNEDNAGGSHLCYEENENNSDETSQYKKQLSWLDNPKFLIQFDSKDWIKDLHFQIIISRSESIWKRRLSMSMINAMMSCYIFKYDNEYLINPEFRAISLAFPKRKEEYVSDELFPFFYNMLSEGANKATQCKTLKIDESDSFGLLLATAKHDTIGAITVEEI
jgi:serine/threonine-protein kinase HipA